MANEPSLLDLLEQAGGTRNATGGVEFPASLVEALGGQEGLRRLVADMLAQHPGMGSRIGGEPSSTNWYWDARHPKEGGTGDLIESPSAPTAGHYRLVPNLDAARRAIEEGDAPLVHPGPSIADIDPTHLPKLQEEQYSDVGGPPWFVQTPGGGLAINQQFHDTNRGMSLRE